MEKTEDNINIYNNSAKIMEAKTPNSIISWITILIILLLMLVILFFIPFNMYKTYEGYVSLVNNESYIILKNCDFPIDKYNKLYIKNIEYDYKISEIIENDIILDVNLDNSIKINNNKILVNIKELRTTVFDIFKNKIKKGIGL